MQYQYRTNLWLWQYRRDPEVHTLEESLASHPAIARQGHYCPLYTPPGVGSPSRMRAPTHPHPRAPTSVCLCLMEFVYRSLQVSFPFGFISRVYYLISSISVLFSWLRNRFRERFGIEALSFKKEGCLKLFVSMYFWRLWIFFFSLLDSMV